MSWESLRSFTGGTPGTDLGPVPGDDVDLDAAFDTNLHEALLAYDPGARLARVLTARVSGPTVGAGRLSSAISEQVLGALRREVAGASLNPDPTITALDLVGIGKGSAVLYLEPATDSAVPGPEDLLEAPDPLDDAVSTVLDLHGVAEQRGHLGRFGGRTPLLKAFDALTTGLDEHDLDLDLGWRSRTGNHRRAVLTRVGRDHARRFLERAAQTEEVVMSGRVTVLDLDGSFTLRESPARNARRYDVALPAGVDLPSLGLTLGETVSVRARRTVARALAGLESKPQYRLLEVVGRPAPLPVGDTADGRE